MSNDILPFVSSVVNEFNERLNEVMNLFNEITDSMKNYTESIQNTINEIGKKIHKSIEESLNTKKSINEGYLQIVQKLANKIKQIKEAPIKPDDPIIKESIDNSSRIINKLKESISDLQLIQVINGLNGVIDRIQSIIQQKKELPLIKRPLVPTGQGGNALSSATGKKEPSDKYYETGAKTKTMDEILEEQRKRKKMFEQYR